MTGPCCPHSSRGSSEASDESYQGDVEDSDGSETENEVDGEIYTEGAQEAPSALVEGVLSGVVDRDPVRRGEEGPRDEAVADLPSLVE